MPFWRLYYHLVWATKEREHFIQSSIEDRLYPYIIRKAAELDTYVYVINGWYDHVHLIASIPPKHAIADVVKHLKGSSAHDINHSMQRDFHFAWQRGYGALSLGERQRSAAEVYVANQKLHHQDQTTNTWLEYCAEFDEGPSDTGIRIDSVPPILHEQKVQYRPWGEPPF